MRRLTREAIEVEEIGMDPETLASYAAFWLKPNGEVCALHRLMMHWTICIGLNAYGYEDRFCYATALGAMEAFDAWDGETGDPVGWHRHIGTGRRRPGGDPKQETVRP